MKKLLKVTLLSVVISGSTLSFGISVKEEGFKDLILLLTQGLAPTTLTVIEVVDELSDK